MGSGITENGKLLFPSEFLAAPDLQGRDVVVEIATVKADNLMMAGGAKARRLVMTFKDKAKKFVVNVTNQRTIKDLYGPEILEWVGKRITLYPTKTGFAGKQVDCLRVRDQVPA